MVIGWMPIGEYDRRVVLLTREMGKLSAFARGARRPNSSLLAATDLFAFGTFRLYAGRNSYTLQEASITNYFGYFRTHMEASLMGQYFCEVLEYCTRENNDEAALLLLAYQSLRALEAPAFPNALVRSIFEIRTVTAEGEFPEDYAKYLPDAVLPATAQAVQTIVTAPIAQLYSFTLDAAAADQLARIAAKAMANCFDYHHFRSLDILETILPGTTGA